MRARRSNVSCGQRSPARGSGINCPTSRVNSVTTKGLPTRAATNAESGVGERATIDFSPSDAHSLARARLRPSTPLNRWRLPLTSRTSPSGGTRLTRGVKRCAQRASRSNPCSTGSCPVDSIRCTPTQSSVEVTGTAPGKRAGADPGATGRRDVRRPGLRPERGRPSLGAVAGAEPGASLSTALAIRSRSSRVRLPYSSGA